MMEDFHDGGQDVVVLFGVFAHRIPPCRPHNLSSFDRSDRAEPAIVCLGVVGCRLRIECIFEFQPQVMRFTVGFGFVSPVSCDIEQIVCSAHLMDVLIFATTASAVIHS